MSYDAILIPGGGVRAGGELPLWVVNRLDRAIERRGDAYLIALSAGTTHRPPPLDANGYPITEAGAEAHYLLRRGVPRERILLESASYDTIGNAYFSLVMHVLPRRFSRLLVITSNFHMPRTRAVFDWIYGLAGFAGLCFESVADAGLDDAALAARRAREAASLAGLPELQSRIRSFAELHQWLFTVHGAYHAAAEFQPSVGDVAETY